MFSSRIRTAFLGAVLLTIAFSAADADDHGGKIDAIFRDWDSTRSPGFAVAVIKDGEIVFERGYGMADLEHNIPITPQTVFYVGSISKQFTAACLAMLVLEGRVDPDKSIMEYLPDLPEVYRPVKVRHLVHHTSGLRDYFTLISLRGRFGTWDYYTPADIFRLLARQKALNFEPGSEYRYSNSCYFFIALIVEKAGGVSLAEFAEERIFKPLGMRDTHFHDDHRRLVPGRAYGYSPAGSGYLLDVATVSIVGGGGLYTTLGDLYKWDRSFRSKQLGEGLVDLMLTTGSLSSGEELSYAWGLLTGSYRGLNDVSHGGALAGYRSYMVRFPEQCFSVICLANFSSADPSARALRVADVYLEGEFTEPPPESSAGMDQIDFITIDPEKADALLGAYRIADGERILKFYRDGEALKVYLGGQVHELGALSETRLLIKGAPLRLEFRFVEDAEGTEKRLEYYAGERKMFSATRLDAPAPEPEQFAGEYYSEELDTIYRIEVRDGALNLSILEPIGQLRFLAEDRFFLEGVELEFTRDEQSRINGFTVDAGRAASIHFSRR